MDPGRAVSQVPGHGRRRQAERVLRQQEVGTRSAQLLALQTFRLGPVETRAEGLGASWIAVGGRELHGWSGLPGEDLCPTN